MYPLCIESCHPQPKVRPSHLPTSVSKKKNFQNGTERQKARQFLVIREPTFWLIRMYPLCIESCHPQPKVRPSHLPTSVSKKKKLSKWNRTPKGSSIFGNTRAYLLVDTCVPIMYRVMSSSTKSTTLAFTDIGFQKIFQNGTERRKARQFLVIREPIFSLVRL
jgi:hypothetical protein